MSRLGLGGGPAGVVIGAGDRVDREPGAAGGRVTGLHRFSLGARSDSRARKFNTGGSAARQPGHPSRLVRRTALFMLRYRRILRFADFRRIWLGATVSSIGDGMTFVALSWLVLSGPAPTFRLPCSPSLHRTGRRRRARRRAGPPPLRQARRPDRRLRLPRAVMAASRHRRAACVAGFCRS